MKESNSGTINGPMQAAFEKLSGVTLVVKSSDNPIIANDPNDQFQRRSTDIRQEQREFAMKMGDQMDLHDETQPTSQSETSQEQTMQTQQPRTHVLPPKANPVVAKLPGSGLVNIRRAVFDYCKKQTDQGIAVKSSTVADDLAKLGYKRSSIPSTMSELARNKKLEIPEGYKTASVAHYMVVEGAEPPEGESTYRMKDMSSKTTKRLEREAATRSPTASSTETIKQAASEVIQITTEAAAPQPADNNERVQQILRQGKGEALVDTILESINVTDASLMFNKLKKLFGHS